MSLDISKVASSNVKTNSPRFEKKFQQESGSIFDYSIKQGIQEEEPELKKGIQKNPRINPDHDCRPGGNGVTFNQRQ